MDGKTLSILPLATDGPRRIDRTDPGPLLHIGPGAAARAAARTPAAGGRKFAFVSDALGIPNVWVAPSDLMSGGRFKFDDYFSTLDRIKEPVPESRDLFSTPHHSAAEAARYRFCKQRYREALVTAIDRVAADWAGR